MNEIERAIERIKEFGLYHAIKDLPNSILTVKAFDLAIKAMKKQIPKIPIILTRHRGGFEEFKCEECGCATTKDHRYIETDYALCPVCGKHMDGIFRNYCDNCGQKIDWNKKADESNLSTENKEVKE